jgi:hypothetical protein
MYLHLENTGAGLGFLRQLRRKKALPDLLRDSVSPAQRVVQLRTKDRRDHRRCQGKYTALPGAAATPVAE